MTPRALSATLPRADVNEIRRAVADYLRVDPRSIDPHVSLAAYGIDSLGALELVASLEDRFGCSLPESLLTDWPTLAGLTSLLTGREHQAGDASPAAVERMRADSRLPDDIRPRSGWCRTNDPGRCARPVGAPERRRRVLVTGGTGFLGTSLVRGFLDDGYDVICVVRPRQGDARARLYDAMAQYGVWRDGDESRVRVVPGDIERDRLGLDCSTYAALAESVTDVCHAAADVNWVSSYDTLRSANVAATITLLRFASIGGPKRFQFVSSLSVCYATGGPSRVCENDDMLPLVGSLPLGYAQSKCVAEALVREAERRGLPSQIFRPALLAGHSESGVSNLDDLIAALLKGCIQLGAAPDLDWPFDAIPVDTAAQAIVRAARDERDGLQTRHLRHPRPRHWRECVLWANVFGYSMTLEPYDAWVARLLRHSYRPDHPLHRLRSFFTRRVDGRTVPEHYQDHVRSQVAADSGDLTAYPALDADRLDAYFSSYIDRGYLCPPARARNRRNVEPGKRAEALKDSVERAMRHHLGRTVALHRLEVVTSGSDHSIIGELTSWKHRRRTGLFGCRVDVSGLSDAPRQVVVKIKPPDDDVLEVAETTAAVCDAGVAREIARFRDRIGIRGSQARELALYAMQSEGVLGRYMPRCYGQWQEDGDCLHGAPESAFGGLVLEHLSDMALMDAADDPGRWTDAYIAAAIDGIAHVHASFAPCVAQLERAPWIGYVQKAAGAVEMTPLWRALGRHAAPAFGDWAGESLVATHERLVETVAEWWPALDRGTRTLIHHDFNPRNIGIRSTDAGVRLAAYDWELATVGVPQRDLAELLCFVLPGDVPAASVAHWIEHHRKAFECRSGSSISPADWREGFRSALNDFLVTRLAFYALIHRVKPQRFLPRVVRTWSRLHRIA